MSDLAPGMRTQGSWLLAWLGGALATLVLALAGLLLWMVSISGPHEAVPSDPVLITRNTAPYLAAAAGILLFFLIGMARVAERRAAKPLSLWLSFGAIVATPAALIVWALQHLGDCFENCRQFSALSTLPPVLAVYGLVLLGTLVAFRIRHGSWRR